MITPVHVSVMEVCEKSSNICGYHVYRIIWDAAIGEDWVCEREPSNEHDRYRRCIAIKKDGLIAKVIANYWPLSSKDLTIVLVVSEEGE